MPQLEAYMLGDIRLVLHGSSVTRFRSQKVPLLLAYLLSQHGRQPSRIEIATVLFPGQDETRGRANLRTTLCRLNQILTADDSDAPPWLCISAQAIGFNWNSDYWLDVEEFETLCERILQTTAQLDHDSACQAIELYRGDFLTGFYEDWSLSEATRLRDMYQALLARVAHEETSGGFFAEAVAHLRELLSLSPFDEAVHRQLIRLCIEQGETAAAMNQYRLCERLLAAEMGLEPAEETQALQKHWQKTAQKRSHNEHVAYGQLAFGRRALAEGHHRQAERSLQLARRSLGELHAPEELEAIYQLGRVALKNQQLRLAQRRFAQLRRLAKSAGNTRFQALALNALGATDAARNHMARARDHYEAAIRLAQRGHHPEAEWRALSNLGRNHWIQGRYDESLRCYLKGQLLCERLKHLSGMRIIQQNLGILYGCLGLFEDAHHCFEASKVLLENDPNPMKLRTLWANWGDVFERQGAYREAEACYRRGYKICWGVEDEQGCAITLLNLASARRAMGDLRFATKLLARILPALRTAGLSRLVLEATCLLAQVRKDQGRLHEAQTLIHEALELLESGVTYEEPDKIFFSHACILFHAGKPAQARKALLRAWNLLNHRASCISRPHYRQSFLEKIPSHMKIRQQLEDWNMHAS